MMRKDEIELPQSLARYGDDDFKKIFLDELLQQEPDIRLERFTSQGGYPADDSLELGIDSITEREGKVVVRVRCFFDEVVPTGCADIKESASGKGIFEVVLFPEEERAYIQYDDDAG